MSPGLRRGLLLALLLGLPPLLAQRALPAPRLDADSAEYFALLRSLYCDQDVDLANEYERFGLLQRYDKIRPTVTGHRRTIFSVGPALLWMPFYGVGDALARAAGSADEGYSAWHVRAVALGSLAYVVLGLLLLDAPLRSLVPARLATASLLLLLYATFLWWYVVYEPVMSHAGSFALSALALRLLWDQRAGLGRRRALALGLVLGLAATVRWQNGLLLLLPGLALLGQLLPALRRRSWGAAVAVVATGLLTLVAFGLGALPQMLAWKAIFGSYLLADPPHGADFLRLGHPYLLQTFFSSRHGLLYWTPVLWGAALGLRSFVRRERWQAGLLLVPAALMSYVNACSGDWWAGGSFSNRRFDSVLPLVAPALALGLAALASAVRRRPALALGAAGTLLTLFNLLFMQQYRRNLVPRDDSLAFADVAANNAALLQSAVGTPLAWPANWLFAAEHGLPVRQFDRTVGLYLFYRQNNLGGVIDLGDERVDRGLLDEGWSRPWPCGPGLVCRSPGAGARLFVPLDVPETLDVTLRLRGRGDLALLLGGRPLAQLPLEAELRDVTVRAPAGLWRRELNELRFVPSPGGEVQVERLIFARVR